MKNLTLYAASVLTVLWIGCQNIEKTPIKLPNSKPITMKDNFVKIVIENVSKYPTVGAKAYTEYKDEFGVRRTLSIDSHRRTLPMQTDTIYIQACALGCFALHVYFLVGQDVMARDNRKLDMCDPTFNIKTSGTFLFTVDYEDTTSSSLKYDACFID